MNLGNKFHLYFLLWQKTNTGAVRAYGATSKYFCFLQLLHGFIITTRSASSTRQQDQKPNGKK